MEKLESSATEMVSSSDGSSSISWNRTCSTEELLNFITRREAQIFAE